ncbi:MULTISPECIES: TetR/AcrR family transcriptional regulator [Actinoplanes]|uniref:TetR/AcrR family transcriptional regulator n=1 Tax=Actinoplanes TaxID=1865 RepID=UPI0005F2BB2B|nr:MULTISPECIES: TetR/AcrR family transcriptional regulator [Actinoplanes]GLY04427.1 TetR family transcriptional regulator [Actinoplanes sp. NBRC 101535]
MSRNTQDVQSGRSVRGEQVELTRTRILDTAERLFAEHGVFSVSNRQISEAAGQGNNTAVGYHFGTKEDLVRAVVRRHATPMEEIRRRLFLGYAESTALRDWVTCIVQPFTDHLASLGTPSWYARFGAQIMTEPKLRDLAAIEMHGAPLLREVTERLHACLPGLSPELLRERDYMVHALVVHYCARREQTLPPGTEGDWPATTIAIIDAVEGLYRAPSSR